jgi:hypothetical protein
VREFFSCIIGVKWKKSGLRDIDTRYMEAVAWTGWSGDEGSGGLRARDGATGKGWGWRARRLLRLRGCSMWRGRRGGLLQCGPRLPPCSSPLPLSHSVPHSGRRCGGLYWAEWDACRWTSSCRTKWMPTIQRASFLKSPAQSIYCPSNLHSRCLPIVTNGPELVTRLLRICRMWNFVFFPRDDFSKALFVAYWIKMDWKGLWICRLS